MSGFGENAQERISETSLVQKGGFVKARGRPVGRKSCGGAVRGDLLCIFKLAGG